jgi:hypothetical protein
MGPQMLWQLTKAVCWQQQDSRTSVTRKTCQGHFSRKMELRIEDVNDCVFYC